MDFSFDSKTALLSALKTVGVAEQSILFLEAAITEQQLRYNQQLVRPGQINTRLYYVLDGCFVCRFVDTEVETGRAINFYMNQLHPFMACIDSYFTQTKTQCELRAIAPATVLSIAKKDLDQLMEEDGQIKWIFDTLLINALIEENELKLKIIACKPDALYQYLLTHFPILIRTVPSKYIAELMGISAEWLSKLKAKPKGIS